MPTGLLVELGATVLILLALFLTCAVLLDARPPKGPGGPSGPASGPGTRLSTADRGGRRPGVSSRRRRRNGRAW